MDSDGRFVVSRGGVLGGIFNDVGGGGGGGGGVGVGRLAL